MLSRASMITRYPQNSIVYEFIVEVFFDRVGIFLDECILRVTCPNGKLVLSKFTFQHCMCHLGYDQYFDPHKHIVISQAITVFMGAFLWKFSRTSITQIMACQRIQWFHSRQRFREFFLSMQWDSSDLGSLILVYPKYPKLWQIMLKSLSSAIPE